MCFPVAKLICGDILIAGASVALLINPFLTIPKLPILPFANPGIQPRVVLARNLATQIVVPFHACVLLRSHLIHNGRSLLARSSGAVFLLLSKLLDCVAQAIDTGVVFELFVFAWPAKIVPPTRLRRLLGIAPMLTI